MEEETVFINCQGAAQYSDLDGSDNHQTTMLSKQERPDVQLHLCVHFCLMVTGTRTCINALILSVAALRWGPLSSGDRRFPSASSIPTQVWPLKVQRDVCGPFQQLPWTGRILQLLQWHIRVNHGRTSCSCCKSQNSPRISWPFIWAAPMMKWWLCWAGRL